MKKGLERFLTESDCHLAVSLHNPFPDERQQMMPAEKAYGIHEMLTLLKAQDWSHQRRLSFEYIVFGGLNDTPRHARELVRLLSPIECRVNLIRFHEIPDTTELDNSKFKIQNSNTPHTMYQKASEETMTWLRDYLTKHGVTTTIRTSRGQDIYAACGLLHAKERNKYS